MITMVRFWWVTYTIQKYLYKHSFSKAGILHLQNKENSVEMFALQSIHSTLPTSEAGLQELPNFRLRNVLSTNCHSHCEAEAVARFKAAKT